MVKFFLGWVGGLDYLLGMLDAGVEGKFSNFWQL